MTEQRKILLKRKIQESCCRLKLINREFAKPLDDMYFMAVKHIYRMSTNGKCIYFDADWLSKLDKTGIDFMLSHQLMHIALGHIYRPKYYKGERFHLACDIVANSNLELLGWKYEKISNVGKIYYETFFPVETGRRLTAKKALEHIPFDPALMTETKKRRFMIDSEEYWGKNEDFNENEILVLSPFEKDPEDLVDDETVGGDHFYVKAEYKNQQSKQEVKHDIDYNKSDDSISQNVIYEIKQLRKIVNREVSLDSERFAHISLYSNLDWRKLLNGCVSDEVMDYSFLPPDRRFQDDFLMPDFNERSEDSKKVLFWIDTSGSIEDSVLSAVYSEIYNAVMQFDGKLTGLLGFFDTLVTPPRPFCTVEELLNIVPRGGGGTDFNCIFRYMKTHMAYNDFSSIVVFTDGEAEFPKEFDAKDASFLWLFSKKNVVAPWGKWAYVDIK